MNSPSSVSCDKKHWPDRVTLLVKLWISAAASTKATFSFSSGEPLILTFTTIKVVGPCSNTDTSEHKLCASVAGSGFLGVFFRFVLFLLPWQLILKMWVTGGHGACFWSESVVTWAAAVLLATLLGEMLT